MRRVIKHKLLMRQQVIDAWTRQSKGRMEALTCPGCHDLLYFKEGDMYECTNTECNVDLIYNLNEEKSDD